VGGKNELAREVSHFSFSLKNGAIMWIKKLL